MLLSTRPLISSYSEKCIQHEVGDPPTLCECSQKSFLLKISLAISRFLNGFFQYCMYVRYDLTTLHLCAALCVGNASSSLLGILPSMQNFSRKLEGDTIAYTVNAVFVLRDESWRTLQVDPHAKRNNKALVFGVNPSVCLSVSKFMLCNLGCRNL